MKRRVGQLLSLLLCLALCLSLFPVSAFALGEFAEEPLPEYAAAELPEEAEIAVGEEPTEEPAAETGDPKAYEETGPASEEAETSEEAAPAGDEILNAPAEVPAPVGDEAFNAPAEEAAEDPWSDEEEDAEAVELQSYSPGGSSEGLLDGYARMMLDSLRPGGEGLLNVKNVGSTLTGATKEAYDKLRPMIAQVAAGERTSTVFSYTRSVSGSLDFDTLIGALLAACPYELYWYDKTTSTWLRPGSVVEISFPVAAEYAADTYEIDPSKGAAVSHAVNKAAQIVGKYSGSSDYAKLEGYKNEICDLVEYNYDAAAGGTAYGNPWQLIWIFDEDPDTKVVCEGYAKGFQYLCDLTSFSGNVTAYCVTGGIPGAHMWNIVTMDNGKNYLVDVTNCDSGTSGYPDYLFMKGFYSGYVSAGYVFTTRGGTIMYTYDAETTSLYGKDSLILSAHNYLDDPNGDLEEPPEQMEPVEISDWSLRTLDGGTVTQDSYADRIQLLVFYRATLSDGSAMCWNSGNTIQSLAQCAWISDPTIKVIAADVDGNDSAAVAAFKAQAAPDCTEIVFALDGGSLMWSIARQMGNAGSVTLAVCAILVDGKLVDFWTGNYSAATCLEHIAKQQGGDEELIDSGVCGQGLTWKLDQDYTLTVSGIGPMNSYYDETGFPWHRYRASIRKVVIGSGATSVSDYAFFECPALTEATIADSVLTLGGSAFAYCGNLGKVTLSKSLTAIRGMCFSDCTSLPSAVIPEGVTELGWSAFSGCSALSDISLPESLTSIDTGAFYDCSSLTVIRLPATVTTIEAFAFKGCTGLTDVYYGGTLAQREALLNSGWETQDNYLFFNATWHYQSDDGDTHTPGAPVRENEVAATCTEDGWYDVVVYCADCGRELSRERHSIPALGHDYEYVDLVWDGYSEATWYFVCRRDRSHTLSLPAAITSERTEPDCDADGSVVYTATATIGGSTWWSTRTETLPALGHDYLLTDWSWDGYTAATASFVCSSDTSHTKTVKVTPSSVRTPAGCERDGSVVYTARVSASGRTYSDSRIETLPALGHDYRLSRWSWSGYTAATAVFTCANDSGHRQNVAAAITSVRTEPTVQADGKVVYTATAAFEGRTYTDTKTEVLRIDRSPGWRQFNGSWYYFGDDGKPKTGWVKSGSSWFYMGTDGVMQTGLIKVSGKLYYLSGSGAMKTGWLKDGGKRYYFESGGAMKTGWLKLDGKWYYLDADGVMLASTSRKIGSKVYRFNASGVCTNP